MKKQLLSIGKIDNGLKQLIERHPGLGNCYVSGTQKQLAKMPGAKMYGDSQIKRFVNDQVPLNYKNKVIKEAFMALYWELYPEKKPKGQAIKFFTPADNKEVSELVDA